MHLRRNKFSILNSQFSIYPLIAFVGALVVYWLTVDSGASYWDCPEYLISAIRLEIGHPPGNPGWTLTHRFVTSFFSNPATQVLVVNLMSGLFTALSAMLLCIVSMCVMRLSVAGCRLSVMGIASVAASLCFAWSDSAWYSAVEAEVYAMSLFLSSLTIWMAFKWAFSLSHAAKTRWFIAIAYIIGFSLGVHQLNLLALPAIAMIMTSGVRRWKTHRKLRLSGAFLAGCAAVGVILKVVMPGSIAIAECADVFAVNKLGLPYWSGAIIFWSLSLIIILLLALTFSKKTVSSRESRSRLHFSEAMGSSFWALAFLMLGLSVYLLIPIRAWANPPVNEGDPSTVGRFADYLDRRQYGTAPLLYGRTPNSRIMKVERLKISESGDTTYDYSWNAMKVKGKDMRKLVKGAHIPRRSRFLTEEDKALNSKLAADSAARGYAVAGVKTEPIFTPELNMLLPRIYSSSPDQREAYCDWTGMSPQTMTKVRISEAIDSMDRYVAMRNEEGNETESYELRPTYLQSLTYLLSYQVGYMYLRYLMWNFSGRQNDVASTGQIDHGNFITGVPPIDNQMLGDQSLLPVEIDSGNAGHNVYFCIPFILGLIGIIWMFSARGDAIHVGGMRTAACYSLVLFLMTGLAIVIYLNQSPGEPRERDYTFLVSFWTFAIWIAMGMFWLIRIANKKWLKGVAIAFVCAIPLWMLAQNFDDHDRSHRSATLDYAANLLESLDEDAILFVDGDNYIFPIWYAQEIIGVRRDVAVVCNSFLGSDWYLPQLMTPRHGFDGIAMTATEGDVALGNFNLIRLSGSETDTIPATEALAEIYADQSPTPAFRHRWLLMGRDGNDWVFDLLSIPGKSANSTASLRELATVDIIATNAASRYPRPVYWHQSLYHNKLFGFYPYTRQGLFTRRLMPETPDSIILTEEALNALPRLKWGGIERMAYPGPDVEAQAQLQRASLIHLADALSKEGRHDMALHVARMAMVRFPADIIPFSIRRHNDSIYFEARNLSKILTQCGNALGDSAAIREGHLILRNDSIRTESYIRYRRGIPASRRSTISPRSNNHSILL